jgi:hypothetical protein
MYFNKHGSLWSGTEKNCTEVPNHMIGIAFSVMGDGNIVIHKHGPCRVVAAYYADRIDKMSMNLPTDLVDNFRYICGRFTAEHINSIVDNHQRLSSILQNTVKAVKNER